MSNLDNQAIRDFFFAEMMRKKEMERRELEVFLHRLFEITGGRSLVIENPNEFLAELKKLVAEEEHRT